MSGIDLDIFRALNQAGSNMALDIAVVLLTMLGFTYLMFLSAVPVWLAGRKHLAFDIVVAIVLATVAAELMKLLVDRQRPIDALADVNTSSFTLLAGASGPSMPSGHATRAFAVAALVAMKTRPRLGSAALLLGTGISLSRVYLGLHWPSDIAAGALLGLALAAAIQLLGSRSNIYGCMRDNTLKWIGKAVRAVRSSWLSASARSLSSRPSGWARQKGQ